MYDLVIVTHLPSFYKVNLYNAINKKSNIFVIFVANQSNQRTKDFVSADFNFQNIILNNGDFETRHVLKSILKIKKTLSKIKFKKVIVSGWDLQEFWWVVFFNSKSNNILALESTSSESRTDGIKGLIKRLFLSRINLVLASGGLHANLLKELNFKGQIRITKGVGIINKPEIKNNNEIKVYSKKFLYLGRLSPEKNLKNLITVFNELPSFSLTIVGEGPLFAELSKISNKNITFNGHIENSNLSLVFNDNDFLILPSLSEPWGLVIEEALYFGLPVIISDKCGGMELIQNGVNGYIVSPDIKSLYSLLISIDAISFDNLRREIKKFSIDNKDEYQVSMYLE